MWAVIDRGVSQAAMRSVQGISTAIQGELGRIRAFQGEFYSRFVGDGGRLFDEASRDVPVAREETELSETNKMLQSLSSWEALLLGAASVLNLPGTLAPSDYPEIEPDDWAMIGEDFRRVGQDIAQAMDVQAVEVPTESVQLNLPGVL
jgi:hypothetical protein